MEDVEDLVESQEVFIRRSSVDRENVVQIIDHVVADRVKNRIEKLLRCRSCILVAHLHGDMEVVATMRSECGFGNIGGVDTNLIERRMDFHQNMAMSP